MAAVWNGWAEEQAIRLRGGLLKGLGWTSG